MKTVIGICLVGSCIAAGAAIKTEPPVYEKYDGRRGPSVLDSERVSEAIDHLAGAAQADTADDAFLSLFSRELKEEPPPVPGPVPGPMPVNSELDTPEMADGMRNVAEPDVPDEDDEGSEVNKPTATDSAAAERATPFNM